MFSETSYRFNDRKFIFLKFFNEFQKKFFSFLLFYSKENNIGSIQMRTISSWLQLAFIVFNRFYQVGINIFCIISVFRRWNYTCFYPIVYSGKRNIKSILYIFLGKSSIYVIHINTILYFCFLNYILSIKPPPLAPLYPPRMVTFKTSIVLFPPLPLQLNHGGIKWKIYFLLYL